MAKTEINWADSVWNPVTGCSKVSEGCRNCYAERLWPRLRAMNISFEGRNFNDVRCHPERLDQPLKWKKPQRIFVNSMSDLFHEDVPDEFLDLVFASMAKASQHTFLILTKRPERMHNYILKALCDEDCAYEGLYEALDELGIPDANPLDNIWLGVSVENQAAADERIPLLLQTPAAERFISAEPLLGSVNLTSLWKVCPECGSWEIYEPRGDTRYCDDCRADVPAPKVGIDWVIAGGESGPKARPMNPEWVRNLRDQCQAANVPFFFKQWGEYCAPSQMTDEVHRAWDCHHGTENCWKDDDPRWRVGKKKAGRILDGRTWDEFPEVRL